MSDRDAGRSTRRERTEDDSVDDGTVRADTETARTSDDPATARTDTAGADTETARTSDDTETARTAPDDPEGRDPDEGGDSDDGAGLTGATAVVVAAVIGLGVTLLTYLWVDGFFGGEVFFEQLFRVAPTVSGGGVGSDWVFGNTVPVLDAAIAITHAADVIMGVAILGMVFVHWAIFRRLSDRMRPPASRETTGTVATDGGERNGVSRTSEDERSESSGSERGGEDR